MKTLCHSGKYSVDWTADWTAGWTCFDSRSDIALKQSGAVVPDTFEANTESNHTVWRCNRTSVSLSKLNKNKKKEKKKNTPASKSFADPFPHHSLLLLTTSVRLCHTWSASSVALNRARSVPPLGKICRAARKINQLHIHYTRKSCGWLCFIIGSLLFFFFFFFSRRPLCFRPPTLPSTLFRFCWRAGQLDPSKTILCLVPPGSSWSPGPSAELLRRILFKEQAAVLILRLHLFAIFCSAVLEALWKVPSRPPPSLHNGPVKMSPASRALALWNNTGKPAKIHRTEDNQACSISAM